MSSDLPGPLAFDETLEQIAGTLWGITERIGDPDSAMHVAAAADHLHSITNATADVLSALAYWYDRNASDLFVEHRGAEQDANDLVKETAKELWAFARELRETAKPCSGPIGALRQYGRRALYVLEDDDVDDEDEVYAIIEVQYATADDRQVSAYARLDVARFTAREIARCGVPGNVYRVVPIIDGDRQPHVAEWPGEGQDP